MNVKGTITKILPEASGTSEAGKPWKKIQFLLKTSEEYNNLYCFEIFGEEKVDNFIKYNNEGQSVDVSFNVSTNEWKGKYYTSLSAWMIKSDGASSVTNDTPPIEEDENDDLPF
jgi:hypothetical protein